MNQTACGQHIEPDFLAEIGGPLHLAALFEDMPDVGFFVKSAAGRFVACNRAALKALGLQDPSQMLGKTDFDLVPGHVAAAYREADAQVLRSGQPLRGVVEAVPDAAGRLAWFITTKAPVVSTTGRVAGVAVTLRSSATAGLALRPFEELGPAVEYVFRHHSRPIALEELAGAVHLSVRQFERRFKRLFGMAPVVFIQQHRVRVAAELLRDTSDTIAHIAQRVGFYDHSHFIRLFRRMLDTTPSKYRHAWRETLCPQPSVIHSAG